MSIKTRLLLSYIAMTVVPAVLFALIAWGLSSALFPDAARTGEGKPAFREKFERRNEAVAGVRFVADTDPDRFSDRKFLKRADEQLNRVKAGLVVVRNGRVTYQSPLVDIPHLGARLRERSLEPDRGPWEHPIDERFAVEKRDVSFSDGTQGAVYVFSDMGWFVENGKRFFPLLLLSLLLVIGSTNGILTFLVSRSIVKPLSLLKRAAERIKEGDLDQEVRLHRRDEIGELGAAFEEMRKRLKESIRLQLQYEENRKQLLSHISHYLRTPLTGIKACVEGIRDGIAETGPMREKYLSMIAKKAEDMERLIDELLLFSKLDLKRVPFHWETIDLAAFLRDFVEELRLDPRTKGVAIRLSAPREPVYVKADREKLRRVIMNIVDNSLKYMDKAEKNLRVELSGAEEATVCIRDNGPGIGEEALEQIFDRFYRGEPSRNAATGGSGLGLAIVKQIIEEHGGRVWAESRKGEGTSIYFALPKLGQGGERP